MAAAPPTATTAPAETQAPAPVSATPPAAAPPPAPSDAVQEPKSDLESTLPASESEIAGAQEPAAPDLAEQGMLETTRRSVRSTTVWVARGVDSWFGDKPFEAGGRVTDGRLSVGLNRRERESVDFKLRLNARVRLPNLEDRAYLYVGRDNDREVVEDTPEAFTRQDRLLSDTAEDRAFFAGLGVALRKAIELRVGFHGIKPYAQARYRQPWTLSERNLLEFRQTFFWRVREGFGSTTALSHEYAVSSTYAIRWLNAATITRKSNKFDWSSVLGSYKVLPHQRLLSIEAIMSGTQHTGVRISEYGLQTKWLQPLYKDWLTGEVVVGRFFPRADATVQRAAIWAYGAVATMRF